MALFISNRYRCLASIKVQTRNTIETLPFIWSLIPAINRDQSQNYHNQKQWTQSSSGQADNRSNSSNRIESDDVRWKDFTNHKHWMMKPSVSQSSSVFHEPLGFENHIKNNDLKSSKLTSPKINNLENLLRNYVSNNISDPNDEINLSFTINSIGNDSGSSNPSSMFEYEIS
ncbi:cystathionine beta-synthase [Sarcoptes scabiei]|nr:cystathionine beta-synthase [Sarcoptes scabiei]